MDMLKNKKTGHRRFVSYNRNYICISRDNGTRYYVYNAKRIYKFFAIMKASK